ncbi:PREDICTED: uncharacterized protein LOC108760108 [Trachymyrmex cornetzi]|uniref:uncharacterized protein LOC108760108 n=1 Tax=Trachymyrmex cornetzi TaxID=471704 RepID=UPI00084F6813|nr:PREDICTED: uncharacterized protein LOC108760108 [Trachymyrmex cornetzi]
MVARVCSELGLGLVAISEPNRVPEDGRWLSSTDNPPSAAITWQWSQARLPCLPLWRGKRFAAVEWGNTVVVFCYFPPSLDDEDFLRDLGELEGKLTGALGRPIVIAGDFNARALAWDSGGRNRRGDLLLGWLAAMDLVVINEGTEPTCVHPRGVSRVDLTLASPSAVGRISEWRVASEVESLSDHLYVTMTLGTSILGPETGRVALRTFPRWVASKVDYDLREAAAIFSAWSESPGDAVGRARNLDRVMRDISEVCMPRKGLPRRPHAY